VARTNLQDQFSANELVSRNITYRQQGLNESPAKYIHVIKGSGDSTCKTRLRKIAVRGGGLRCRCSWGWFFFGLGIGRRHGAISVIDCAGKEEGVKSDTSNHFISSADREDLRLEQKC
jgi:hypothetical protein